MPKTKTKRSKKKLSAPELQHLYENAVQSVDADLDFAKKEFKKRTGRPLRRLREDFCGSAALACAFVKRHRDNRAIGIDLDGRTLEWARCHNVASLGEAAERLELRQEDVRTVTLPKVDVTMGLNFSYWVFKSRQELLQYFTAARRSLIEGGILVLDLFGGTGAMLEEVEERPVPAAHTFDGTKVPRYTYYWNQAKFNPITHDFECHIGFRLKDGTEMDPAFSYEWRFWTIPELTELLREAGFAETQVYTDDWDDDTDESNGIYRRRRKFDNEGVWVGYLLAFNGTHKG